MNPATDPALALKGRTQANAAFPTVSKDSDHRPRPVARGLIAGSGTATTTALGAYIALSKPGGTSILWIPLTISIIAVIVAGFAAGAAIYWTGKRNYGNPNGPTEKQARPRRKEIAPIESSQDVGTSCPP